MKLFIQRQEKVRLPTCIKPDTECRAEMAIDTAFKCTYGNDLKF